MEKGTVKGMMKSRKGKQGDVLDRRVCDKDVLFALNDINLRFKFSAGIKGSQGGRRGEEHLKEMERKKVGLYVKASWSVVILSSRRTTRASFARKLR